MHYILFICTGNYYRSRYAEVLFNYLADQEKLQWKAFSRGTNINNPDNKGPVSPNTLRYLKSTGIDVPNIYRYPRELSENDLEKASMIVAMKETEHKPFLEKNFPDISGKIKYWNIHDIDVQEPEKALKKLTKKINKLFYKIQDKAVANAR